MLECNGQVARSRCRVGFGMKATWSRDIVFTTLFAMPLLCGLHTGVLNGFKPMDVVKLRVLSAV